MNGDGKLDLVVANHVSDTVSVLLGNGDGTFQPQTTYAAGSFPTSVAIGDVNGDGRPDLVVANAQDGTASVLLGNGDGTFQTQTTVETGSWSFSVAIGDVNGDGRPDLVFGNSVTVLLNIPPNLVGSTYIIDKTSPVITTSAAQTVAENTTLVAALTSTDADTVGTNPATFSITGGTDAALFDIVGGNLVFKTAPDYETGPHSYQVQVSAFDGINTTAKTITVNLTDVNDNAPAITVATLTDLNNLGISGTVAAPLTVGMYTFTTDDGELRYAHFGADNSNALGNNTDLGYLNIEIAPGANVTKLEFMVGLAGEAQHNRENVSFFDTNDVPLATIGVSRDGGFQFVSFVATSGYIGRVLITDIDLNSSVVSVDNLVAHLAVASFDVAENTTFFAALASVDLDTVGINPATFSISGGVDAALFHIVTALDGNQSLQFLTAPDYETDPHSYQVEVSAFDGVNTTTKSITVNLTDVNDNAPVITTAATQTVAENTTFVAALTSTDADTVGTNPATFSITGGTDAALFDIVGGNLVFKTAPDYETDPHSYQVEVSAFDGVNTTAKTITVNVTDVNDNAPVIMTAATQTVAENTTGCRGADLDGCRHGRHQPGDVLDHRRADAALFRIIVGGNPSVQDGARTTRPTRTATRSRFRPLTASTPRRRRSRST